MFDTAKLTNSLQLQKVGVVHWVLVKSYPHHKTNICDSVMRQILCLVLLCSSLHVKTQTLHVIYVTHTGNDINECWEGSTNHPCETLDYALEGAQQYEAVKIQLSSGNYTLGTNESITTFQEKSAFQIVGEVKHVFIHCIGLTGLSFYNSSNLLFQNITLRGCGAIHNSSSINSPTDSSKNMEYLPFLAGLYFLLCGNVELYYVEVTDSLGTGVVFYSTGGQNIISYSNFTNNVAYNRSESYSAGGGGVAIEFLYCIPGDLECTNEISSNIPLPNKNNATYLFINCTFANNNGSTSNYISDTYIIPHSTYNVALGRGGGLAIVFKGSATGNLVTLQSCIFRDNSAIWGGGMLIEFQDSAINNTVTVQESIFINNTCTYNSCTYQGTGGGGARILIAAVNNTVQQNSVKFIKTRFHGNRAYFGGGVSFMTWNPIPLPDAYFDVQSNQIIFNTVTWTENIARLGSAIDLSILASNGSILHPVFQNCVFQYNTVHYTNNTAGTPSGSGTLYTDSVPIRFIDNVQFTNNTGSAIVSLEAVVEFDEPIVATFENNSGHVGGGIALYSKAYILIHKQCHFQFQNNVANLHGGGIYWEGIGNHELVSSRNCFVRYEDPFLHPSKWNVTFDFIDNTAGLTGNAIYGTTLLGCLWGGRPFGNLEDPHTESYNVFCWNSTDNTRPLWNYGTRNCSDSIATSPGYFADENGKVKCESAYNKSVVPGDATTLPVVMLDDRFARVPNKSLVFSAEINTTTNYSTNKYLTYEKTLFTGSVGDVLDYKVSTINSRVISSQILLTFEPCPPGFQHDAETQKCISANYPFILTHSDLTASIQRGYWMGNTTEDGLLKVSLCSYCSFNPDLDHTNYVTLPSKNEELEAFFCDGLNRKGVLCGQCKEGYGPAVNSDQFKCVKCSTEHVRYSWVLYIVGEYLPITLALLIIIIFNISLTSGPANSFVFFAQVISSTTFGVDADGLLDYTSITPNAEVIKQIYTSIYGIWNLDFFVSFDFWLYCLGPNVTALHIIALNYLKAAYPLLVLLIVAIFISLYDRSNRVVVCLFRPFHRLFARCFGWLNLKRSILDAFATFIVLSYVKFTVTCAFLLYPNPLYTETGHKAQYVSFRYGSYSYLSLRYAPYLISSIVILLFVCVLLPAILFLYSIKPFYSFLERCHFTYLLPGEKAQLFLNSFHHCYKDGTNGRHDRRYFASLYFFLRLIIIISYSYAFSWAEQYVIQQILCTVTLFMISIFQPYKKKLYNIIDTVIFTMLATINIFLLYNRYLVLANLGLSATCFYIQIILIFLPLVYITAYVIFYVCRANKKSLKSCCFKLARKGGFEHIMDHSNFNIDVFSFGDFMDDVDAEGRFQRNEYHGPIKPDELNCDVGDESSAFNVSLEPSIIHLPRITPKTDSLTEPLLSSHDSPEEHSTNIN